MKRKRKLRLTAKQLILGYALAVWIMFGTGIAMDFLQIDSFEKRTIFASYELYIAVLGIIYTFVYNKESKLMKGGNKDVKTNSYRKKSTGRRRN